MNTNKVIVDFSKTKRIIDGPFMICGEREILRSIANQILHATDANFSYGWVSLLPCPNNYGKSGSPVEWD